MKLEYKILWLDDNINAFIEDERVEEIKEYVTEKGFDTTIDTKDNHAEFFETLNDSYDLILTDYHMEGLNGDGVVKKIRNESIFTEILFYTAKAQLEDTQKLDRISFLETTADHQEEIIKKTKELIDLTIKKFQDIVTMRGMVMSETSDLDAQKLEILNKYINSNSSDVLQDLHNSVFSNIKCFVDEKCGKYNMLVNKDSGLKELIKDNILFSSSRKIEALSFILEKLDIDDFSQAYKIEIIGPRNQFAHAKLIEEDGSKFFKGSNEKLDDEFFKEMRQNILKHKENLDSLKSKLEDE
jgi:CheY-like chemotaxis protein